MTGPMHEMGEQAPSALADLDPAVKAGPADLLAASRARRVGRAAFSVAVLVVVGAIAFGAASVAAPDSLRWLTGVILVVLLAATWLLCAHAGGHAWFVPVPALALAVLWAFVVSGHSAGAAWWLVAMSAAAAALGLVVASTALTQRLRSAAMSPATVRGATGTALTSLAPVGVVRVASETWTAKSLSGVLPAGSPVHVVRLDGVRLDVWSEVGTVPDQSVLDAGKPQS